MNCRMLLPLMICGFCSSAAWWPAALAAPTSGPQLSEHSPKSRSTLSPPPKFEHSPDDVVMNQLDAALQEISSVYVHALFAGTHSHQLDVAMHSLEMELFDLLEKLYRQERMSDYMKYEREVSRRLIIYSRLKKLFGYSDDENEVIESEAETEE